VKSIQEVLKSCDHQVPICYQKKVVCLHQKLCDGTPFTALGGKRIQKCRRIIRFKIGREFRLLYQKSESGLVPDILITRQRFESILKLRSKK